MSAAAVYYWGPRVFSEVKQVFAHPTGTPAQFALEYFGMEEAKGQDPVFNFGDTDNFGYDFRTAGNKKIVYFLHYTHGLRPYFVPINGSDRQETFNRGVNPVTLPIWLRLVLLPDFCGLNVGGEWLWALMPPVYDVPSIAEYMKTPNQCFRYSPCGKAPDFAAWVRAYPKIKALFGGTQFTFQYDKQDGSVLLTTWAPGVPEGEFMTAPPMVAAAAEAAAITAAGADALPYQALDFVPAQHPQGHLAKGYLYFGQPFLDAAAEGHWLKIADLNHTLVMGTSGFGKSVFLNQILQGVVFNAEAFDQVYLVDLKGGVELYPYQALGQHMRVVYRLDDLPGVVAGLVQAIEGRLEAMRRMGARMWPGAKTLLVIDEYAQIQLSPESSKEERQKKQELLANLNKISMLGRAAGVLIWAQLQKGTSDVMDSSFRANLSTQVCFKVPNKLTAAGMFGSTDELAVDPVKMPKGRFVLYDATDGGTYYLQARMVPPPASS